MGAGSLSLGGTTLPDPVSQQRERASRGDRHELADGSVAYDHIAYKYVWIVSWRLLSAANRNTIKGRYEQTTTQTFDDWDGVTGTVNTLLHPYQEEPHKMADGTRYDVTLTLEEV